MNLKKILPLFPLLLVVILFIFFTVRAVLRPEFHIIIQNGSVVDGSGNKPFRADVGIRRGRIKEIGILAGRKASIIIDASGLLVCPGFIDLHTHADDHILKRPDGHNFVRQGVTTVVGGNCGASPYPIGFFLKKVQRKKSALNFCTLVGHNTVRKAVMGNANREPGEKELEEMKTMVERAMQEGAVGLSTGLKYTPGVFTKTGEIIELAKVVQEYGGFYATHMREEGVGVPEALREALAIGKAADIPVQISHHKIAGAEIWGSSADTLALVQEARRNGMDITLDQYPYPATATWLTVLFPPWSLEGSPDDQIKRWQDKTIRPRLEAAVTYNIEHDRGGNNLDLIMIARYTPDPALEGLTIKRILEKKHIPVTMANGVEMIIDLQLKATEQKGEADAIYFCPDEKDIERIMKYPYTAHASDGGIPAFNVAKPHPRNYGTFPRVFKIYVREKGILTFQEAVRKMTSLPASRLGLSDRGSLKEGYFADISIVDPLRAADTATWQNPHQYPQGIPYVLVNGKIVVKKGKITGKFPGKVIYGKGKGRAADLEEIMAPQ